MWDQGKYQAMIRAWSRKAGGGWIRLLLCHENDRKARRYKCIQNMITSPNNTCTLHKSMDPEVKRSMHTFHMNIKDSMMKWHRKENTLSPSLAQWGDQNSTPSGTKAKHACDHRSTPYLLLLCSPARFRSVHQRKRSSKRQSIVPLFDWKHKVNKYQLKYFLLFFPTV